MQVAYLKTNQSQQKTLDTKQVSKLGIVFLYERTS
ncbi:hypothetical protein NIES4071_68840 [Calothrix sp. NIES-4071]|nr:hypothetical protein NIES4071_68840 [Calothrix sp. NIES-4071]BAZ61162.1 hypothetical protein NIES4105_68800 [Calothrix sp. NIES-4105]